MPPAVSRKISRLDPHVRSSEIDNGVLRRAPRLAVEELRHGRHGVELEALVGVELELHHILASARSHYRTCPAIARAARIAARPTVTRGISSHTSPSRTRPACFLFLPPHCLKKKGTFALRH